MPGEIWTKSGEEWQDLIVQLLKIRSATGDFLEVPDRVKGDCGLEGFSRDGCAYQCYANENPYCTTAELTNKQKAKITRDLRKLVKRKDDLVSILGQTVIRRWVLVVPKWDDKSVLIHAQKKVAELVAAGLPFISPDCGPAVVTLDDFKVEHIKLAGTTREYLHLPNEEIPPVVVGEWLSSAESQLVQNITAKCASLSADPGTSQELRDEYVRHYLRGQSALDEIKRRWPDMYEKCMGAKRQTEQFLRSECLIGDVQPGIRLANTLNELLANLNDIFPGLSKHNAKEICYGTLADWLMRCPLRFPK